MLKKTALFLQDGFPHMQSMIFPVRVHLLIFLQHFNWRNMGPYPSNGWLKRGRRWWSSISLEGSFQEDMLASTQWLWPRHPFFVSKIQKKTDFRRSRIDACLSQRQKMRKAVLDWMVHVILTGAGENSNANCPVHPFAASCFYMQEHLLKTMT